MIVIEITIEYLLTTVLCKSKSPLLAVINCSMKATRSVFHIHCFFCLLWIRVSSQNKKRKSGESMGFSGLLQACFQLLNHQSIKRTNSHSSATKKHPLLTLILWTTCVITSVKCSWHSPTRSFRKTGNTGPSGHRQKMGNLFVSSSSSPPPPSASSSQQTTHEDAKNKKLKTYPKVTPTEWKQVVERFTSELLHPTFLPNPVRGSTVSAAEEYHPSDPNSKYLMPGNHKHLGGAYDPTDGCIYGVPAHSRTILCLYRDLDNKNNNNSADGGEYRMKAIPLPESIRDTQFKWLRGILAHGYLWAIPAWADSVLCVDVDAYWGRRPPDGEIVKLLPLPPEHKASQWQWHGAGINHEKTAIYCIPSNAKAVLKVDIPTKTTSLIPIDFDPEKHASFNLDSSNKWYGGIVGVDNAVYGIPYRTCSVLRIDCRTDTATLVGPDYGTGKYNWHGGILANGKIFAHPSHANTVLVIDTNVNSNNDDDDDDDNDNDSNNTKKNIVYEVPIHRASYDQDPRQNYKWLGGNLGADGNIYCPACDTSSVLKINPTTNEVTTMGFAGTAKNKWQGGILSPIDNCIYCIPANGNQILRIATDPSLGEGEKPVQLLGDLPIHKDKWQGGYAGKDGALYFIPENGYRVLKVTPPSKPPNVVDCKLPIDDVKIEMM